MNEKLIAQIQGKMNSNSTEELLNIYKQNDRGQWTDEAFIAIQNILKKRGEKLPDQCDYKEETENDIEVSSGRRFINFVGDIILFRIVMFLLIIPFVNTDFIRNLARNPGLDLLFVICMLILYYFIFEVALQRTPAKLITGSKVVMKDGSKPDAFTIFKRTLSRFVPFEPFSGNKGTWWHDRWTKTRVVNS